MTRILARGLGALLGGLLFVGLLSACGGPVSPTPPGVAPPTVLPSPTLPLAPATMPAESTVAPAGTTAETRPTVTAPDTLAGTATVVPTAAPGQWQQAGLSDQELYAIAVGSKPGDAVYAGGTGLFRSADGGQTWQQTQLGPDVQVSEIAVSPADGKVVYAGSGADCSGGPPGGQYRSQDGGTSWTLLPQAYLSLQPDARQPGTVTAISCTGVVRSADYGQTWQALADPFIAQQGNLAGDIVAVAPGAPNVIYALYITEDGKAVLRHSSDAGATWQGGSAPDLDEPDGMLVDATRPDRLWVVAQNGLYASEDGATTFTLETAGLEAARTGDAGSPYQIAGLAALYRGTGNVLSQLFTGTFGADDRPPSGVYASADAGHTWTPLGKLSGPSVTALAIAQEQDRSGQTILDVLYAATDSGVYRLTLNGAS